MHLRVAHLHYNVPLNMNSAAGGKGATNSKVLPELTGADA
jgi:hypothetical protein